METENINNSENDSENYHTEDNSDNKEQDYSEMSVKGNNEDAEIKKEGEENVLENLHQSLAETINIIYKIHNICYEQLRECYGSKSISLPINIEKVVKKFHIKLEYDNLNFGDINKIDQNIAQLCYEKEGEEVIKKIIVDNSSSKKKNGSLSNLEKYAVAYELGKTIVGKENVNELDKNAVHKLNLKSKPYALPRLSAQLENFEYELCAIFLLLPLELFFEEFESYLLEIKDHPVMMDNWILHLSQKADIPRYQLINGYQYIKFGAYQYYKEFLAETNVKGTDYRLLYNL